MREFSEDDVKGKLLESFRMPVGRTGLVYLKGVEIVLPATPFDRPALLFPRGPSRILVDVGQARSFELGSQQVLVLPAGSSYGLRAQSTFLDVAVFLPDISVLDEVAALYELRRADVERVVSEGTLLPRSRWLDECHHRYVFERVVCNRHDSVATLFLETEIVKEAYFASAQSAAQRSCVPPLFDVDSPARRAVSLIESNLFEEIVLDTLADRVGASRSTLLRSFRKELGMSPQHYIRERRLDEAMSMLARPGRTVGEVAVLLGYRSLSAFSLAFRRRFGFSPTDVARRTQDPDRGE